MIDAVIPNTGHMLAQMSADSGYCSEDNIQLIGDREAGTYITTGRQKHGQAAADSGTAKRKGPEMAPMRECLRPDGFENPHRLRKQTVEPVFDPIKHAQGFRQSSRQG